MVRKIKGPDKITIGRYAKAVPSVTPFFESVKNNFLYPLLGLVAILLLSGGVFPVELF